MLNETLPLTKLTAGAASGLANCRIKIVDSSCVAQDGANRETVRIHMCYDLTLAAMDEVHLTDKHTAESFSHFDISPGDIYLADAGYGKGKHLHYIVSRQAGAILRVTPNHLRLSEDPKGKETIDVAGKLNSAKNIVDFTCFVHSENRKYVPCRIIASRLPEDKATAAILRKKRSSLKRQSVIRKNTLVYAEWVILMTSLNYDYSAHDILELYRARWQIELLFKRIKQFFKIVKLRKASIQHSKALILLWLIVWSLTERDVAAAEIYLNTRKEDMNLYSVFTMSSFFLNRFKAETLSLLAKCYDTDDALLIINKRLKNHKSTRLYQYTSFRFGFLGFFMS